MEKFDHKCLNMLDYHFLNYRGVEQWLARWAHNPKVVGSSPIPANFLLWRYSSVG